MTEFVCLGSLPVYYCNKCGDRCDVLELAYLETYGCAYKIAGGNDPYLLYYPMFKDGSVQLDEVVVEIEAAFEGKELRKFFEDIKELFPDKRNEVMYIFRPHIDEIKEFVTAAVDRMIDMIFQESHQEFKTADGGIEPLQELRLDRIKQDLVDIVTTQVKQNL
jgi:hypothetical protein